MPKLTDAEMDERCVYHPPTPRAVELHDTVNGAVRALMGFFNDLPDGRELALAMTKLEEARHWANAAIARNHARL